MHNSPTTHQNKTPDTNVILILVDSCNRHYLSPYGCQTVNTPNIQHLADKGVIFTNHVIGSAPCMPARREIMTGRQEFLFRGWGHLEPYDVPMALRCRQSGAVTQMVTDHYHYWENSAHGYIEHFNGCEMIRGHELDFWKTELQPSEPDWVKAINKYRPGWGSRYYQNVARFTSEEDFFSPKVFKKAAEWLDANHNQDRFFLHIESFDAHEPFHVPEPYRSMYTNDLNPEYTCWPPYQDADQRLKFLRNTSMAELDFIRAQYQGKLTMVDKALGQVWAMMDKHNLWDNTTVILTTDHGHELAEAVADLSEIDDDARDHTLRNPFGKQHPHYLSHANIPLVIWHPHLMNGGKSIDALTCTVDIYNTVLEAIGSGTVNDVHSRSVLPLMAGEKQTRDLTYWGTFGEGICCTDGEDVLLQGCNSGAPLNQYSSVMNWPCSEAKAGKFIPGVDCQGWQIPINYRHDFPSILYKRNSPLFRESNIIGTQPDIAAGLRRRLKERITEDGCPSEQFDRLGL
ncbi:MAG: sulfatase [Armatimonadota bacterium]